MSDLAYSIFQIHLIRLGSGMDKLSVITPHFSGYRQLSSDKSQLWSTTNDLQQSQGIAKIFSGGAAVPKVKLGPWSDSPVPSRKMQDSLRQPKPLNFNKLNTWLIIKLVAFFSQLALER